MKTHILHVEPHDDLYSVQDKIAWAHSDLVLLVFPNRRSNIKCRLDLKLLQRHSQACNTQIAIITRHPPIVEYAKDLDLPVFPSLRLAQQYPWGHVAVSTSPIINKPTIDKNLNKSLPKKPASDNSNAIKPTTRYIILFISVFFWLLLITSLLPSATIVLYPQTESQQIEIMVNLDPAISHYSISGDLPAEIFTVVVEGRQELSPTGKVAIPVKSANGEVEFTNLSDQPIIIPNGTVVKTTGEEPIRFSTTQNANIAAEAGANITVPIKAINPGTSGNLPPGSITAIDGDLNLYLAVTNSQSISGGQEQQGIAPTEKDYENLHLQLQASLWQTAIFEARTNHKPEDIILDEKPVSIEILQEEFNPQQPLPASVLSLQLRVKYEILIIPWQDMETLTSRNLDAVLPQGYSAQKDTVNITSLNPPLPQADGTTSWKIRAQRQMYKTINPASISRLIKGKTPTDAINLITERYTLEKSPRVDIYPSWWPRLPFYPVRMEIHLIAE